MASLGSRSPCESSHELGDQGRHLVELLDDVPHQRLPLGGREPSSAGKHLDVRAQAGERRAELVRRVRDELALRPRRRLQGSQHRVEAGRKPAQLIFPVDHDAFGQVSGLRDVLGRLGQAADGRERCAGDDETEASSEPDPCQRDQDQIGAELVERVLDLGERPGDLDRVALAERDLVRERDHAEVGALDLRVAEVGVLLVAGYGQNAVSDRERHIRPARTMRRPVFLDELRIPLGTAKSGAGTEQQPSDSVGRLVRDLLGSVAKGIVELRAKLTPDDDEDDDRRQHHRQRDGDGRGQGEARAKGHGSRSAYPTPRTVWISRGRLFASVLRRR